MWTGSASACACCLRPRMRGSRSRAHECNQVSTWLQSLHRRDRLDDCNLLESRLLAVIHEIPLKEVPRCGRAAHRLARAACARGCVDPGAALMSATRFQPGCSRCTVAIDPTTAT